MTFKSPLKIHSMFSDQDEDENIGYLELEDDEEEDDPFNKPGERDVFYE